MSYRSLEVWQLARRLAVEIHSMTTEHLPRFEMYEEGSQIRKSIKSVKSNIVEGYGRRRYKQEFLRFLTCALASCDETADHLGTLRDTGSLADEEVLSSISELLDELGKKLNKLIQSVEREHQHVREPATPSYADPTTSSPAEIDDPATTIEHPASSIEHRES